MRLYISTFFTKSLICSGLFLSLCKGIIAQESNGTVIINDSVMAEKVAAMKRMKESNPEKLSFKERVAFRTNMLGWVLATPNVGVQFDISPWDYNKMSVGAELKFNPGSNQTFDPKVEYKLLDAKVEFRKYFRESMRIKEGQKRMPKFWRAYYWGVYAGYTDYTVYMGNGFTGKHFGLGGTAGWEIPMMKFKNGALDFDFGISAGWIYGKSMKRVGNAHGYEFTRVKNWHIVPYPIISDVKVALVYRFKSVKEKYNRSKR